MPWVPPPITVVMITRNRSQRLRQALARLCRLPEEPPVIVVDNGSTDDTASVAAAARVRYVALGRNAGAAGRNVGVREARTPLVAFSDDDSCWLPGALARAGAIFEAYPRLGLIAARVQVGEHGRVDPVSQEMERSCLSAVPDLPGPRVLGFLACGALVRRDAFLQAGGFHPRFGVGGEERLLAIDLARHGWGLAYCADVAACHEPEALDGGRPGRRARMLRNDLWTTWLRRGARPALAATLQAVHAAARDPELRSGLGAALVGLPWALRERCVVAPALDADLTRMLSRDSSRRMEPP